MKVKVYSIEFFVQAELDRCCCYLYSPTDYMRNTALPRLKPACNVLCENPMAIASADCLQMIEAAKINRKIVHRKTKQV